MDADARGFQRKAVGARVDVMEAAVLDNGVSHTGVAEHSAHHHVVVVVVRRLVAIPVAVVRIHVHRPAVGRCDPLGEVTRRTQ
jgi:hypothetical protein